MPSGHASHKNASIKHSHDNGHIDTANDLTVNPENILNEGGGYPYDEQGTEVNPARPKQEKQED